MKFATKTLVVFSDLFLAILISFVTTTSAVAQPSEVWVDDAYCDSCPNDGHTWGYDAFDKIQNGIDTVESPGSVYVAAGTYTESINFIGKAINLKGVSGAKNTIIDGGGVWSVVTFESGEGLDSVLDGFTITNAGEPYNHGIKCYQGSATIINNIIKDNAARGIFLFKSSSVIRNNTIFGNPEGPFDAIESYESSPIIEDNKILATDPNGNINAVHIGDNEGELPQSFRISSNIIKGRIFIFVSSAESGFENEISNNIIIIENGFSSAANINIEDPANLLIINNTILKGMIYLQRGGDRTKIINNIITGAEWGIESTSGYSEILNNDLWNNDQNYHGIPDQTGINGNISVDPMLVDPDNGDFHLKPSSPCKDAGRDAGVYVDFDGDSRPQGIGFDIGADEIVFVESLVYTPVTPCRIVDTRNSGGIINATTQRDFHVYGSGGTISGQGGTSAGCPSPLGEPLAAHINVVAVDPTGKGNLQAFPLGAGPGAGLIVNYNAIDTNLANAGTVKSVSGGGPDITVTSRVSSVHAVIDVLGYYYPAGDLFYTAVTPCRIADTRNAGGIINATAERDFHVYGSGGTIGAQGGTFAGCSSPLGEPLAAHINVVAVDPTGKGNLQAYPLGAGPGAGLIVNYNAIDTNLANAGTVKSISGDGPDITVTSRVSSVHAVIDVLGYYYPAGELMYTAVTPCRIVDTRNAGGIISATTQRDFHVYGPGGTISAQGGTSAGCESPLGEPLAAHINMVAVNPTGKGNLQAFPLGAGPGAGLIVNYNAIDTNLANAGTVKSVTGGGPDITVTSRVSSVHAVIDVLGYYYPAP